MVNKLFTYIVLILFVCCSCTQGNNNGDNGSNVEFEYRNDSIIVASSKPQNITIKVYGQELVNKSINNNEKFSVINLIRTKCTNKNQLALEAIKNDNVISLSICVPNQLDTIVNFRVNPDFSNSYTASISGDCAKLISPQNDPNTVINARRWLYQNNQHLPDSLITSFVNIINDFNKSESDVYITNDAIPVMSSFAGKSYHVSSDMTAKHYVLFAAANQKEINDFIEEIIANNFELTSSTINAANTCYRTLDSNGYKCIFLIGINEDWTHSQIPLGLVAIDNMAPNEGTNFNQTNQLTFGNNTIVKLPQNKPTIYGSCSVRVADWDGNGAECNVSLVITFSGDVKTVIVHREGSLAKWTTTKNFTYNLNEESSPIQTAIKMHLDDGDNFIPVTMIDNHGNTYKTKLKIQARFVRVDTHDINIDNNIYNY